MVIQTYVAFGQKVFGQILSSDFILNWLPLQCWMSMKYLHRTVVNVHAWY
jgi:hypothetical protein